MIKRIFTIIIMIAVLAAFLIFTNISAVNFAIDMFQVNIAAFILTCIVGGISLIFSDVFITYLCVLAVIESIKEAAVYHRDMKTFAAMDKEKDNDDGYDPHADYH